MYRYIHMEICMHGYIQLARVYACIHIFVCVHVDKRKSRYLVAGRTLEERRRENGMALQAQVDVLQEEVPCTTL